MSSLLDEVSRDHFPYPPATPEEMGLLSKTYRSSPTCPSGTRRGDERLLAEKEIPGGLTGLLATGLMDDKGILPKDLTGSIGKHSGNFVNVYQVRSYRSTRRVAVVVWLKRTEDIQPWRAVRAELVGPGRRTLRVYPPWQREPFRLGVEDRRVVIEADATEEETRGSFTLKLWDAEETRSVIVSGVTFP